MFSYFVAGQSASSAFLWSMLRVNEFSWAAKVIKALCIPDEIAPVTTISCNKWDSPEVFWF